MRAGRVFANLQGADVEAAESFYTGYLGPSMAEFKLSWAPDGTVIHIVNHRS